MEQHAHDLEVALLRREEKASPDCPTVKNTEDGELEMEMTCGGPGRAFSNLIDLETGCAAARESGWVMSSGPTCDLCRVKYAGAG